MRGKISIFDCVIERIEEEYHGQLFSFKIITDKPIGKTNENFVTFAADEMESYSYWLISFDDCFKHQEAMKAQELAMKEAAEQEALLDKSAILRPDSDNESSANFAPFQHAKDNSIVLSDGGSAAKVTDTDAHKPRIRRTYSKDEHYFHPPLSHESKEDPGVPLAHKVSFRMKEMMYSVDDSSPAISRSRSFSSIHGPASILTEEDFDDEDVEVIVPRANKSNVTPVLERNMPISQLLPKSPPYSLVPQLPATPGIAATPVASTVPASAIKFVEPVEPIFAEINDIEIKLKQVSYPLDRLSRRIKIWFSSYGFSLTRPEEIVEFVNQLKSSEDDVLKSFSEEKFEHIEDWTNLLEVLRKYEQKVFVESSSNANIENKSILFSCVASIPQKVENVSINLDEKFSLETVVQQVSMP